MNFVRLRFLRFFVLISVLFVPSVALNGGERRTDG
jgi:hypothetical protein